MNGKSASGRFIWVAVIFLSVVGLGVAARRTIVLDANVLLDKNLSVFL